MARLATILSFRDHADDDAVLDPEQHAAEKKNYREEQEHDTDDDAASDASDDSFEFPFARPLGTAPDEADALADDLFAHGRIIPAYPVFRRQQSHSHDSATAPPSPDSYCAWTPRSAPGSPAREPAAGFPKSASTGQAVPRFRLRDLVGSGAGRRSHSDGKEKFLFLQPTPKPKSSKPSAPSVTTAAPENQAAKKPSTQKPKQQSKKKGPAAPVTEMDMATAHRLFYSKPGAAASAAGAERPSTTTKKSYLPYRPAIVGFFAAAHGLRPKHHPY